MGPNFPDMKNYGLDWEYDFSWINLQKIIVIHWKTSPLQPLEIGVWHWWALVKMPTARAKRGWAASILIRWNRSNGVQFYLKYGHLCFYKIFAIHSWKCGCTAGACARALTPAKALCCYDVQSWTVNRSRSQWGLNMHQSVPPRPQLCLKCGQMDAKCT